MEEPQLLCIGLIFPEWVEEFPHVCKTINDFLMPDTIDAAVYNDWQLVVQVHGETRRWTEKAMDGATGRGRLDIVKWLHDTRTEGCTMAAMDGAVVNGHFVVVMWLEANYGFGRCSNEAVDLAIANGHFKLVERLLCRNWTRGDWEQALDEAAVGRTHVVKLLLRSREYRQNDISDALRYAVQNDYASVVRLLVGRCSPSEIKAASAMIVNGGANSAEISSLLRGAEYEKRKEEARIRNDMETLERID